MTGLSEVPTRELDAVLKATESMLGADAAECEILRREINQRTTYVRIDRIDTRGNIREHYLRGDKTLCGITIENHQEACGNARCGRCEQIAAMLDNTEETT